MLRNKRGRDSERPTHRDEEWPPLAATREKPSHRKEDPTPLTDEWIKKMWYICVCVCVCVCVYIYMSAIKKKEIMPFAAAWMDLEIIILSEVHQTEKDKYHMISHVESKI